MTAVNDADKLYLGTEEVARVYAGGALVWEPPTAGPFAPDDLAGLAVWLDASAARAGGRGGGQSVAEPRQCCGRADARHTRSEDAL